MGLAKNLEVYRSMHMDGQAHKMVTLQNVDKYAIRRGTSSMQYQRPTFIGFELFKDVVFPSMGTLAKQPTDSTY